MPDLKISQLPVATTPLAGTELVPLVQGGVTVQSTVNNVLTGTVPSGTANGVLYLNGSKVVSSGSALTFDGTNLATTGTVTGTKLIPTGNVTAGNGMYLPTTNTLAWSTNGAEGMRLDSSGNLGLGVTPSAWASSYVVEQVNNRTALVGATGGGTYLGNNWYNDGSNKYLGSDLAALYGQVNGQHLWYTAPSGTAGNAITFTQAMTLDASGNLLVGGTSAPYSEKFGILATGATSVPTNLSNLNGALALISTGQAGTAYGGVGYQDSGGGGAAVVFGRGNSYDTQILFCTNPSSTTTAGAMTERARITSTGNVVAGGSVALATTATDGFLYVPTCAGTPTGTPTAITGMAPIVVNTTNNKLYFYSGGQWRDAGP